MKLDRIELDLCVNVVPYPHEEIEDLKETLKETKGVKDYYYDAWKSNIKVFNEMQADLYKERLLTNETLMTAQHWKKQYEGLLVKHAKVLEEQQYFEGKEKFYNILLKPSMQIKDFLDELNEQDELPENNTLIFCTNNYQAVALKDLIKSYNNVIVNTIGNNYTFPNGARLFVKVVTNTKDAFTRYGGLVGNNVLINSFMKSDVELCQWACSRARYRGNGYQPEFIVYDF